MQSEGRYIREIGCFDLNNFPHELGIGCKITKLIIIVEDIYMVYDERRKPIREGLRRGDSGELILIYILILILKSE